MKRLQSILSTAIALTVLAGCSTTNLNNPSEIKTQTVITQNTELTDFSESEVAELNKLFASQKDFDENKSFSIKTAEGGKDVTSEMLLFNPKAAKRAKFWFLKNANQILNAGASPRKRWFLERKLGGLFPSEAFKNQVLFWVVRADLLRIKEVSLDDSYLLAMAGITSVPHLARFNNVIDQTALKIQLSLLAFQYGMPIPSLDKVESWTKESTTLAPVIY